MGQSEAWLLVKLAADKKQGDLSLLLKSGADPNAVVNVEWREFATSPLLEAAVSGHTRVARMLLSAGADIDTSVGPGYTALYNAAFNGHYECVQLLLSAGANVNCMTADYFTPLYIACQEGHHEVVRALVDAGADVDHARPNEGATALYISAQHGHWECVEALLSSRVTIDKPMHDGSTPLMISCYMQHLRVVELLLRAGASLHVVDRRSRTALDWAKRRGDPLVIALVQEELAARGAAALRSGNFASWFGWGDSSSRQSSRGAPPAPPSPASGDTGGGWCAPPPAEADAGDDSDTGGFLGGVARCLIPCLKQPSGSGGGCCGSGCCAPKKQQQLEMA